MLEKWILKIIKIDNMKQIQNIIKKYNKISFINNFTNLKKFWIFAFFGNNCNNGLKNFVLGSLNAELCHLLYYYKKKIRC